LLQSFFFIFVSVQYQSSVYFVVDVNSYISMEHLVKHKNELYHKVKCVSVFVTVL
jgi:hypothetical protein